MNEFKIKTKVFQVEKDIGPIILNKDIDICKCNFIYIIKNTITGMVYIGQSSKSFKYLLGRYRKKFKPTKRPIEQAILEFKLINFTIDIVEYCNNEDLDERESFYINLYNCVYPNGYNRNLGGKHGSISFNEEHIKKISISRKGKYTGVTNNFYGKTHSDEVRSKIVASNIRRTGEKRKPYSDTHRNNLRIGNIGKHSGADNGKSFKWVIEDSESNVYTVIGGFKSFCKDHNIKSPELLKETLTDKRSTYKGWKLNEKISINTKNQQPNKD